MKRSLLPFNLGRTLAVCAFAAALLCSCRRPSASRQEGPTQDRPSAGVSAFDAETTDAARLLAGMRPNRPTSYTRLTGLQEWRDWEAEANGQWATYLAERVRPVRAWADDSLKGPASRCQTLLCPFGGSQFLTAYQLVPSCEGYILVGAEPVGQVPSIDAVTAGDLAGLAEDVRRTFPDVFPRSKVPASAAKRQGPRLSGVAPSLLIQLARIDARIVSAARFDLAADGRPLESVPLKGGNARAGALNLTFEVPNGRPQSLVYIPADLDDDAIRRHPGLWTFLRLQAPFVTLLVPRPGESAERCTLVRDLARDQSAAVVQALPPWVPVGAADWQVSSPSGLPTPPFAKSTALSVAIRRTAPSAPGR
jgi:hypothetical protein